MSEWVSKGEAIGGFTETQRAETYGEIGGETERETWEEGEERCGVTTYMVTLG